jgi:hypothetical protein
LEKAIVSGSGALVSRMRPGATSQSSISRRSSGFWSFPWEMSAAGVDRCGRGASVRDDDWATGFCFLAAAPLVTGALLSIIGACSDGLRRAGDAPATGDRSLTEGPLDLDFRVWAPFRRVQRSLLPPYRQLPQQGYRAFVSSCVS